MDLFSRPMNLGASLPVASATGQPIDLTKPAAAAAAPPTGSLVDRFEAAVQRFEDAYLKVSVDFKNLPAGTTTRTEQRGIDLSRGVSMAHAH